MKVEEILKPKSLEEILNGFCDEQDIPLSEMREFLDHNNAKKEFLLKYVGKAQAISSFLSKIKTNNELNVGDLVYHKTNRYF
jgi:hypothetical protein